MLPLVTVARERDWRMSSVLSSVAAAGLFLLAFWRCFTRRRLSKRGAADEPGLFRWLSAYFLSQNTSSFSSLSGLFESFSVSEVFPEEAAKYPTGEERLQQPISYRPQREVRQWRCAFYPIFPLFRVQ